MTHQDQIIQDLKDEIKRLQRIVFLSVPLKTPGIKRFWLRDAPQGFGGASDYEAWLRTLEHHDLQRIVDLHSSAIDAFRYRRRFVQHELERRHLHSSYGKHAVEHLADLPLKTK